MSAFNHGSRCRSNAASKNRFSNMTLFDPWWSEIKSVFVHYDRIIDPEPDFPEVIQMQPLEGFLLPCYKSHVKSKIYSLPRVYLKGLRAIFLLPGTRKQYKSWNSDCTAYGQYYNSCVFLHAHRVDDLYPYDLVTLKWFFLNDVLIHEIGHHNDTDLFKKNRKQREDFANNFVLKIKTLR